MKEIDFGILPYRLYANGDIYVMRPGVHTTYMRSNWYNLDYLRQRAAYTYINGQVADGGAKKLLDALIGTHHPLEVF